MIHQRIGEPRISHWVTASLASRIASFHDGNDGTPACARWELPANPPPRGIDPLLAIQAWQNGSCALCGRGDWQKFRIDHCHRTGLIRGELCNPCNSGESRREDAAVVRYRLHPPAVLLGVTRMYDRHDPWLYGQQPTTPPPKDPYEAAAFLEKAAQQEDEEDAKPLPDHTPDWLLSTLDNARKRFAR
jgi:hypothetical protein